MLSTEFEKRKKEEIEAVELIRRAYLLYFIFTILILSLTVIFVVAFFIYVMGFNSVKIDISLLGFLVGIIAVSVTGTLIYLYYLYKGFTKIGKFINNVEIGKYGIILSIIGITSSFFNFSMFFRPSQNIFLIPSYFFYPMLTLSIIGFIGVILIAVALWRIGEHYKNTTVTIGAIFLILINFIGAIILYMGFGDIQKKIRKRLPPPPMPPWV